MTDSDLVERLLAGDRRALARVISKIEREDLEVPEIISEIYPHTGMTLSVGFTGQPGVGKRSIIAKLIELYREEDKRIGVVSVDPSSPWGWTVCSTKRSAWGRGRARAPRRRTRLCWRCIRDRGTPYRL